MKRTAAALAAALVGVAALLLTRSCEPGHAPGRASVGDRQQAVREMAWVALSVINEQPRKYDTDPWGTPYAVFVMTADGQGYEPKVIAWEGQEVRPAADPTPGVQPPFVEVISAGPDRTFNTADDIHSWDKPE